MTWPGHSGTWRTPGKRPHRSPPSRRPRRQRPPSRRPRPQRPRSRTPRRQQRPKRRPRPRRPNAFGPRLPPAPSGWRSPPNREEFPRRAGPSGRCRRAAHRLMRLRSSGRRFRLRRSSRKSGSPSVRGLSGARSTASRGPESRTPAASQRRGPPGRRILSPEHLYCRANSRRTISRQR